MTGFGKAQGNYRHTAYNVEVRAVNSKQLDLNLRLPAFMRDSELGIRKKLASELIRGKVDVAVHREGTNRDKVLSLNQEVFDRYYELLNGITEEKELDRSALLSNILRMPEVLKPEKNEKEQEEADLVLELVMEAVEGFREFRATEGRELGIDLQHRIDNLRKLMVRVEPFETEREETVRQRLTDRLSELNQKVKPDEDRLEQELLYYIEKFDITEEKVRLTAHCKYFEETMDTDGAVGRKLGFISQEIGREINTLGSKANHSGIQKLVVQMKDELEKIKEQVLNVL